MSTPLPRDHGAGEETSATPARTRRRGVVGRALAVLGPGLITGASDDDPSGIATYAMAGAAFGFGTLWTALVTFPMMAAVQFTCAKVGMMSGMGVAAVLRRHYARPLVYVAVIALFVANTINVGADLGAVAEAIALLIPVSARALIIPVAVVILALQVFGSYRLIARVFKWLTLALFAYIGAAFFAHPDAAAVLRGTFVPTIQWNGRFLSTLVAVLGTTISPSLFFWQASQEVEEERANGRRTVAARRGASPPALRGAAWDVQVGMLLSNVVMYFIILASAATLFASGKTDIETAVDAAQALTPLAGRGATVLFALGLIGSGLLAVPVLTGSAAYALAEAFRWRSGLDRKLGQARRFYAVIAVSTLVGMAFNFTGVSAMRALFWSAVINGFVAPPLLVAIMLAANNPAVMRRQTNGLVLNVLGWLTAAVMAFAALGLVLTAA